MRNLVLTRLPLRKGNIYAMVFYDLKNRCVLDLILNRDAASVSKLFESKGIEWCLKIKKVSCDLSKAYKIVVKSIYLMQK